MKNIDKAKSSIQLLKIYLSKSEFNRKIYPLEDNERRVSVDLSWEENGNIFTSKLGLSIFNNSLSEKCVHVEMVGEFKAEGETDIPLDYFANVNAPSIIFPYCRHFIRELTLQANISPLLLPLINFQMMYRLNKESDSKSNPS